MIATTDPVTLPDLTTFYVVTNLPTPGSQRAADSELAAASLEEVVRLYGLRMWVEQSYKQVKHALGWSQYQVRSDRAMRRHWQLVCCAFSFCWYHASHGAASSVPELQQGTQASGVAISDVPAREADTGEKKQRRTPRATRGVLAQGTASGPRMVGALDHAAQILAWVVQAAPTSGVATPTHLA